MRLSNFPSVYVYYNKQGLEPWYDEKVWGHDADLYELPSFEYWYDSYIWKE